MARIAIPYAAIAHLYLPPPLVPYGLIVHSWKATRRVGAPLPPCNFASSTPVQGLPCTLFHSVGRVQEGWAWPVAHGRDE